MHPVLFTFGAYYIRATAVFTGLSALAAFLYLRAGRDRARLSEAELWSLTLGLALACFLGAIGADALLFGRGPAANLGALLRRRTVQNGLFYGSFWASVLAAWLFCRRAGKPFAPLSDLLAEAATLGLAIKRWGCLVNGCCHGLPSALPWAVAFTHPAARVPRPWLGIPLHPVQVYESLACLALLAAARASIAPHIAAGRLAPGSSFAFLTASYALLRLALEPLRSTPPGRLSLGLSTPQWLAAASLAAALAWGLRRRPAS